MSAEDKIELAVPGEELAPLLEVLDPQQWEDYVDFLFYLGYTSPEPIPEENKDKVAEIANGVNDFQTAFYGLAKFAEVEDTRAKWVRTYSSPEHSQLYENMTIEGLVLDEEIMRDKLECLQRTGPVMLGTAQLVARHAKTGEIDEAAVDMMRWGFLRQADRTYKAHTFEPLSDEDRAWMKTALDDSGDIVLRNVVQEFCLDIEKIGRSEIGCILGAMSVYSKPVSQRFAVRASLNRYRKAGIAVKRAQNMGPSPNPVLQAERDFLMTGEQAALLQRILASVRPEEINIQTEIDLYAYAANALAFYNEALQMVEAIRQIPSLGSAEQHRVNENKAKKIGELNLAQTMGTTQKPRHTTEELVNMESAYQSSLDRIFEIKNAVEAQMEAWRLPKRELREKALNDFVRSLITGTQSSGWVMEGLFKESAQDVAGTLWKVIEKTSRLDDDMAKATVTAIETSEEAAYGEYEGTSRDIGDLARDLQKNPQLDKLPANPLFHDIKWLKENWTGVRLLIIEQWPGAAEDVVDRLTAIFDPSHISRPSLAEPVEIAIPESVEQSPDNVEILETEFSQIAEQLNWVVFPPGTRTEDVKNQLGEQQAHQKRVNWERIDHLLHLANNYEGTIYRSLERGFASSVPYLVAVITVNGRRLAVAECPEIGNATYIVDDIIAAGSWEELMSMSREDARSLGAVRIVHPKEDGHLVRIINRINSLLVIKP